MLRNCWEKDGNKGKRPKSWNSGKGETANAAVDANSDVEMLLCHIDGYCNEVETVESDSDNLPPLKGRWDTTSGDDEESVFDDDDIWNDDDDDTNNDEIGEDVTLVDCGEDDYEYDDLALTTMTFPNDMKMLRNANVWIADTAATVHTTSHDKGMKGAVKAGKDSITMGNGSNERTNKYGDVAGAICDNKGTELKKATLTGVAHVPTAQFNLFSLSRMQLRGWQLHGDSNAIWITKSDQEIRFDMKISTATGAVYCMYFNRGQEIANVGTSVVRMTVNEAHDKLGHSHEDAVRATAKQLGWEIKKGGMKPCDACNAAKAKQKNVEKDSDHVPAKENAERIYLDLSKVKAPEGIPQPGKPNWRIMVDERTNLKFSDFFGTKDGMIEPTCEQIGKWKNAGLKVKFIRCDNAGENKKLAQRTESSDWQFGINFEFTGRDTPQRNHLAELGFATLYNKGRAMMIKANLPKNVRYLLYKEAFKTATMLDGLVVVEIDGIKKTRYEHFFGKNPKFTGHLRYFGEAGTVKTKTKTTPKL
jgi:hypothetical protein